MFITVQLISSILSYLKSKKFLGHLLIIGSILLSVYLIYRYGYDKAVMKVTAEFERKIEKMIEEANKKYDLLNTEAIALRKDLEQKNVENQLAYEKGKEDAEDHAKRVLAQHRADIKRLSIEVNTLKSSKTGSTRNTVPTSNTTSRATLSDRSAEFLVGLATQADHTQRELNLCKATLVSYTAAIKAYNKKIDEIYQK